MAAAAAVVVVFSIFFIDFYDETLKRKVELQILAEKKEILFCYLDKALGVS